MIYDRNGLTATDRLNADIKRLREENKKLKAKVKELEEQLELRNETLDEVLGIV